MTTKFGKLVLLIAVLLSLQITAATAGPQPAAGGDVHAGKSADPANGQGADLLSNTARNIAAVSDLLASPKPADGAGQTVMAAMREYMPGSGAGGGLLRWDASSTAAPDNGVIFNTAGNSGPGRWIRILSHDVSVQDFGAACDGKTDDTSKIQAAVNYAIGSVDGVGKSLYFGTRAGRNEVANCLISAPIRITRSQGWTFYGTGVYGSTITQTKANAPIFEFVSENTHTWTVRDLFLTYAAAQPATNKEAVAFFFNAAAGTGAGIYKWTVERVNFSNGYQMFAYSSAHQNLCWSFRLDQIFVTGGVSGNFGDFIPTPTIGQPGISIGNIYIHANAMTLPHALRLSGAENLTIDNIEVNNGTNIGLLALNSSSGQIGSMKVEYVNYDSGFVGSQGVVSISDSHVRLARLGISANVFNIGANSTIWGVYDGGVNDTADIGVIAVGGAINYVSGTLGLFATSSKTVRNFVTNLSIVGAIPTYLSRISNTTGADATVVRAWADERIGFNNGKTTPIALTVGDPTTQYYATPLAGDLTISLPVDSVAIGTQTFANIHNGLRYRIVRTAAATGAFNILVKNAAGTTLQTMSAAASYVEFEWLRTVGWVKVGAGTIN